MQSSAINIIWTVTIINPDAVKSRLHAIYIFHSSLCSLVGFFFFFSQRIFSRFLPLFTRNACNSRRTKSTAKISSGSPFERKRETEKKREEIKRKILVSKVLRDVHTHDTYVYTWKSETLSERGAFLPSCTACKVPRPIGGGSWRPSSPSWKGCTPVLGDQYSSPLRAGCNSDWKEKEWDCIFMTGCHFKIDTVFRSRVCPFNRDTTQSYLRLCFSSCVYGVSHTGEGASMTPFMGVLVCITKLFHCTPDGSYFVSCPSDFTGDVHQ